MDIKFDFQNAQMEKSEVAAKAAQLKPYLDKLCQIRSGGYNYPESFINLPFDKDMIALSEKMAEEKGGKDLKYIVIVGIGGSNLGALALYEAIFGKLHIAKAGYPKILFLDTNDQNTFEDVKEILSGVKDKNDFLINIISKSGATTETVANFEALRHFLESKFGDIKDRVVATTDMNSKLWDAAQKRGFSVLEIPQKVGGRFSVFSAVGIFPLMLAGVDVGKLFQGAKTALELGLEYDSDKNLSLASAIIAFFHYKNGLNINNSFFFNPNFEGVGKWYRQLLAESLGKREDRNGNIVNIGITPIVSVGSIDLHSMAQLFLGGPKDKLTTFVYSPFENGVVVPEDILLEGLVENIAGKSFAKIMSAIYEGVKKSYTDNMLPFIEIIFPSIDEYVVGYFMQFKMLEVIFLAELLNVDAFNQPAVEEYKEETRRLLRM